LDWRDRNSASSNIFLLRKCNRQSFAHTPVLEIETNQAGFGESEIQANLDESLVVDIVVHERHSHCFWHAPLGQVLRLTLEG
jgi:hypothetical protein